MRIFCDNCGKEFGNRKDLINHLKEESGDFEDSYLIDKEFEEENFIDDYTKKNLGI